MYSVDQLKAAHKHATGHGVEVRESDVCGCFYCCETFSPANVEHWLADEGDTALCPRCGIDSVLASRSGLPVTDWTFLRAMHQFFFENVKYAEGLDAQDANQRLLKASLV